EDDDPAVFERVLAMFTPNSDPVGDVHFLIVAARLKAKRTADAANVVAAALVGLDRKFEGRRLARDTNWPLRVAELHAQPARKDPALNAAVLAHPDFSWPGNALLTRCPGLDVRTAAEKFLAASSVTGFAWT